MAEMEKYSVDGEFGCGFMGGIFQRRSYWPRKASVRSLPSTDNSKRQRSSSEESACKANKSPPKLNEQPAKNSTLVHPSKASSNSHKRIQGRRPSDAARSSTSSSTSSGQTKVPVSPDLGHERKLKREPIGHLGNLRQTGKMLGNNSPNATVKTVDYLSRNLREKSLIPNNPKNSFGKLGGIAVMGNIVRKNSDEFRQVGGVVNRLDPEAFKSMGNEAYKQGRFEDALALYDRAIGLDSNKATYRCNKSAALIGLGRVMEAVFECKEAILIEPSYQRAHHRLANLYLRVGEAEKALYHYKHSGSYAYSDDIAQAQALQNHLSRCTEVRKLKEWNNLIKETQHAISSGADSGPQVYALQVEALLNLYRHEEAYATYQKGPNFSIDSCTKLIGPAASAYIMMIQARVYLAAGRFEDAVSASKHAARLDPSNKEVNVVVKRARAVTSARLSGNFLFKASKFSEAFVTYNEGLENDPYNAVLLCNRAACRSKLGQYEKAVEDCTTALNVRPSYSKARLRRADCNAKGFVRGPGPA
uniref:Uncharacterized protein n=1 Tax=Fagus sylvatica TaxID=28930 RepID=A0A2N9G3C3_FAGSY